VREIADLLSQKSCVGEVNEHPISRRTKLIQVSSADVEASARYSASVEDRLTVDCFLAAQDMRLEPRYVQKPVVDLLVSTHPAQSESENHIGEESFESE